jgi:hypothetical protein
MVTPLSKADLAACKAGYYECCELDKELERASACGLNVDEQQLHNTGLKEFYRQVLDRYSLPSPVPQT